jgi:hypothetical protein
VGRTALAALVLSGLTAPAALAATAPKWTAKGAITKLNTRTIAVHGTTCRITSTSPARTTLRLYYVGAEVKVACTNGVLHAIDVLKQLPSVTSTGPQSGGGTTLPAIATQSAVLMTQTSQGLSGSSISSSNALVGRFSITAVGGSSITAGRGGLSLTCTLGEGSPDVSGFQVGDTLSDMRCRNGVLTSLTPAG